MAIMRLWHGRVPREKGDAYERFLIEWAVPDYGSVDGLLKPSTIPRTMISSWRRRSTFSTTRSSTKSDGDYQIRGRQ